MKGQVYLIVDFKGDLQAYRDVFDDEGTRRACDAYYEKLSDVTGENGWSDLLSNGFVIQDIQFDVESVQLQLELALGKYNQIASNGFRLELDRDDDADPHTCVQWVFKDGQWEVIYNFNLIAQGEFPKEILWGLELGTPDSLKAKFRAIVSIESPYPNEATELASRGSANRNRRKSSKKGPKASKEREASATT